MTWNVPTELVSVCVTDVVGARYECTCDVLRTLYAYTGGRGAWVGRRLRVYPTPAHSPLARDNSGHTWTLTSPTTVTSDTETLDVVTMLQRYVREEYWQRAQDDLRYREKCVGGTYVSSPDDGYSSSED